MGDVIGASRKPKKLVGLLRDAVNATAFVLFIAEFQTFPLWGELLLVPLMTIVGMMTAMAGRQPEHAITAKFLTRFQMIVAIGALGYSVYWIATHFAEFVSLDTLREFGIPIVLTAMFLPFLYLLLLYCTFEQASVRMCFMQDDEKLRQYAIFRSIWIFRRDLEYFHRFMRDMQLHEGTGKTRIDACLAMSRQLQKRENNPPVIFWDEGWSPYEARKFLEAEGLPAGDYHHSYDEWWAYSTTKEMGEAIFPADFTYRIHGTDRAVTRMKLVMGIFLNGGPADADERFTDLSAALITRAVNAEAGEQFKMNCAALKSVSIALGDVRVSIDTEYWSIDNRGGYRRYLRIQHPKDDRNADF
ncbi:hypothetical protein ABI_40470 [Asticcacaulis biprosthecium C19]|uniref:Uncharacterized protein n=1 Tax=Asticcacaulis biprosthecium C19 TaxID=715226 RepID=F4QSA4_9CAUL|nr:hypothetical protein [Asticcacaulis biprosthecium]EGF89624.1 hypothetical protein ABI_40470 [Asticcacaulis biprosthecium C19]